jgi:hypothetical protein
MQITHTFDFHSPYPIEDCVNMLLAYTPPRQYDTRWGRGMGVKLDDKILVKVYEQDDATYKIEITPRPRNSVIQRDIQAIGILQADADGTHVVGSATNRIQHNLLPIIGMIAGLAFGAIVLRLWFIIPFSLVILGVVWIDIIQTMNLVSRYAQDLLEPKGVRKKFSEEGV